MVSALIVLVPIAIIVIVFVVSMLAVRGKMLKCPECGTTFKAPMVDNKLSGLGWTFPYTGRVKCPNCGQSRNRRDYLKPTIPTEKAPAT